VLNLESVLWQTQFLLKYINFKAIFATLVYFGHFAGLFFTYCYTLCGKPPDGPLAASVYENGTQPPFAFRTSAYFGIAKHAPEYFDGVLGVQ
jgi:hypothetical protein